MTYKQLKCLPPTCWSYDNFSKLSSWYERMHAHSAAKNKQSSKTWRDVKTWPMQNNINFRGILDAKVIK